MCYSVYVSTDLSLDLGSFSSDLLRPALASQEDLVDLQGLFSFPCIWVLGSGLGCGCHFRHLMPDCINDLWFSEPVDWFVESAEQIEATRQAYRMFKWMLEKGGRLELADLWTDFEVPKVVRMDVSLSAISEEKFRFFENRLFRISL